MCAQKRQDLYKSCQHFYDAVIIESANFSTGGLPYACFKPLAENKQCIPIPHLPSTSDIHFPPIHFMHNSLSISWEYFTPLWMISRSAILLSTMISTLSYSRCLRCYPLLRYPLLYYRLHWCPAPVCAFFHDLPLIFLYSFILPFNAPILKNVWFSKIHSSSFLHLIFRSFHCFVFSFSLLAYFRIFAVYLSYL